jgi:putative transcriptional regulator
MIHLQIKELIAEKSAQWGRRILLLEVAKATGMMRHQGYNTVTEHLDKLCAYFQFDLRGLERYTPRMTETLNISRLAA